MDYSKYTNCIFQPDKFKFDTTLFVNRVAVGLKKLIDQVFQVILDTNRSFSPHPLPIICLVSEIRAEKEILHAKRREYLKALAEERHRAKQLIKASRMAWLYEKSNRIKGVSANKWTNRILGEANESIGIKKCSPNSSVLCEFSFARIHNLIVKWHILGPMVTLFVCGIVWTWARQKTIAKLQTRLRNWFIELFVRRYYIKSRSHWKLAVANRKC